MNYRVIKYRLWMVRESILGSVIGFSISTTMKIIKPSGRGWNKPQRILLAGIKVSLTGSGQS